MLKLGTDVLVATAQIVDACMRLKLPYRIAPTGIRAATQNGQVICGPVIPVRHYGSVDIFLEAIELNETAGKILVIDNERRDDEACIGDLVVLEAKKAGIIALVVNGLHRDTADLRAIGLPVFSYGAYPAGPARMDQRHSDAMISARFGNFLVTTSDTAFLDDDGVLFVRTDDVQKIVEAAQSIKKKEVGQAALAVDGVTLRAQFQFKEYLLERASNPEYTFRNHLSKLSKSIEE